MKANVLEKPTCSLKHVYTEVILDRLIASNEKIGEIIHSINTFDTMSFILSRQRSKLRLPHPTDLGNVILSNVFTKFSWAAQNSGFR